VFLASKITGGGRIGFLLLCLFMILCKHATAHTATEPSFYSSRNHDRRMYDYPRPRPKRRGDIPHKAIEPISSSRYINYGEMGHPYEQVSRLREEKEERRRHNKQRNLDEGIDSNQFDQSIFRILQNNQRFQPLRIHFDTTDLDRWSFQSTETAVRIEYLKSYVLPRMARTWSSALSVIPVMGNLKIDYNMCPFGDPATSPSFRQQGVGNTDLVIYVTANSDFCSQRKVLASAYSCFWDQFERPTAGTIDFCLNAIELEDDHPIITAMNQADGQQGSSRPSDMSPESDKALQLAVGMAVHEIAHVLGITSRDMLFYYDSMTGFPRTPDPQEIEVTCVTGNIKRMMVPDETTLREKYSRGVKHFEVTLPTVRQVARNQFNCQRLTGAPLENQPTSEDCFGSHFEERYFFTESLSAVLGGVPEMLSSLTLGLLHDSGWYKPDYSVAMVSPFGHGAGCEFVEEPCIVDGKIPSYSSGSFCNTEYKVNVKQGSFYGRYGCDPTHTSMGICDLVDYATLSSAYTPPPIEFQYYPETPDLGALTERVDFCPTYSINPVSCQEVPGRLEKLLLPQLEYFATAVESSAENSRCFNTDRDRPICLEAECDGVNQVLNVKVAGRDLTCDSDGQTHLILGTNVTFECPNIMFMCPDLAGCPANCAGHGQYSSRNIME